MELLPFVSSWQKGQTIGNIQAPQHYVFPLSDTPHIPLSKEKDKINRSNGHPRTRTLARFKEKILDIFFIQYADKRRNPLVQIHAPGSKHRYPCTQSSGGVPK